MRWLNPYWCAPVGAVTRARAVVNRAESSNTSVVCVRGVLRFDVDDRHAPVVGPFGGRGTVLIADGLHGAEPDDPSELRRIRTALLRQADQAGLGSGVASRALAAIQGLDQLLALGPDRLTVLTLDDDELKLEFASDDEDALTLWEALTGAPGRRTRDLLWQLVTDGVADEDDARAVHHLLQSDDLHNLGGPAW